MAANKSELDELHRLLTRAFTQGIENDLEDGVFNPAFLSAAAKFLKDNEITAEVKSDEDLSALRAALRESSRARRAGNIVDIAQKRAMGEEP